MLPDQEHLSQDEIDALLEAVASGDQAADAKSESSKAGDRLKRYDFRRPDRFSKEQMRALRMIHENWARRISVSLTGTLRTSAEVSLADIDQGMYGTLVQQIPDQGVYLIISLAPLTGHFMLYISLDTAMVMLDRMMGGPGSTLKLERQLTELEVDLLRKVAGALLMDLEQVWEGTAPISPRVDDLSLSLSLTPIALPADAIVFVSFEVRVKGNTGGMVLALPYSVLKPIANNLNPYTWIANAVPDLRTNGGRYRAGLQDSLSRVKVSVQAVLGTATVSLEELASLQRDDVLPLDSPVGAPFQVLVNGHPRFLGEVGTRGRKLALEILQTIEEAPGEVGSGT